jgi:hypothetical protein
MPVREMVGFLRLLATFGPGASIAELAGTTCVTRRGTIRGIGLIVRRVEMRKSTISFALVVVGAIIALAAVTLTVAFGDPNVECTINGANVSVEYTIGSTDASPSTVVETLRDSSNVTKKANSYNIAGSNVPGGWVVAGRVKTYDATFQATGLADGD